MEFNQRSFMGGMNLIIDDTRLLTNNVLGQPIINQYREAFNIRNRFDVLDSIQDSVELYAPSGNKQGIYTFNEYILLFVAGLAFYQHRSKLYTGWLQIQSFKMDATVPRLFLATIPISTTLYARQLTSATATNQLMSQTAPIVSAGTPAGVVVQDGINQPYFIFIDNNGNVQARVTQKYSEWFYDNTPPGTKDKREYVPIGTQMVWLDGILWVLAPDNTTLLRSVSGRPLDFVINVDTNGNKGGDAYTTAYSVGVNGITCLALLSGYDGIFVSATGRFCYLVSINRNPGAPILFGEPTFIRQYLFDAGCVNERSIIDILGDTAFIDATGIRSFNAVTQLRNEGRNSVFSKTIDPLFKGTLQDATDCAIVFDNYALFAVTTIYGPKIIVYDTLTQSYSSIDDQSNGKGFKQFAKIETFEVELYGITNDDKVMKLYSANTFAPATVRLGSVCSQNPKQEMQPSEFRCVLSRFTQDSRVTVSVFANNRLTKSASQTKNIQFVASPVPYTGTPSFSDVDTQVNNIMLNWTSAGQGWKIFHVLNWTGGGSITNVQAIVKDLAPVQPLLTQATGTV